MWWSLCSRNDGCAGDDFSDSLAKCYKDIKVFVVFIFIYIKSRLQPIPFSPLPLSCAVEKLSVQTTWHASHLVCNLSCCQCLFSYSNHLLTSRISKLEEASGRNLSMP